MSKRYPALELGTAQLGLVYGATNRTGLPSDSEAREILQYAIKSGVCSLDTARAYGCAEDRIGAAIHGLSSRPVITTKLDHAAVSECNTRSELVVAVRRSVEASLRALGMDSLDILMLHQWSDRHASGGVVWDTLRELHAEGVITALGVSLYSPNECLAVLEQAEISHIQLPFNLLDWRWEAAGVPRALLKRPDVAVHARSLFLQGILVSDTSTWPVVPGLDAATWYSRLRTAVKMTGRLNAQDLCIAYARAQPWIQYLLIGVERLAQLQELVALFDLAPLTPEQAEDCAALLAGAPELLLRPDMWRSQDKR